MKTQPRVSIIVPAYNAQDYICETLDSIIAQSYDNIELIIVNDGSTDKTSDIVQNYSTADNCHCYYINGGSVAKARNMGIKRSSGDFICFIDADDIVAPDRIATQVEFMQHHPPIGLVFNDYRNFTQKGPWRTTHFQTCSLLWPQIEKEKVKIIENPCGLLALENFGIAGSFLMRRNLLDCESDFDCSLKACEDFHFYFRLARHTKVGIINKVGLLRRLHDHNMSSNAILMLSEGARSRSLLRDGEHDSMIKKHFNMYVANCHNSLSRIYMADGNFLQSMKENGLSLLNYVSLAQINTVFRNIIKIIVMALGRKGPMD